MAPLLKGVSRSFWLSIRLLPAGLRRPVGLGYLLARASDTIADAPGLAVPERLAALDAFDDAVQRDGALPMLPPAAGATQDEQRLLVALPRCIEVLGSLDAADQADVREVLRHITRGQRLDVARFGAAGAHDPATLATEAELHAYTWLVAGCVGEFWTRLGFRHVGDFAWLPEAEMLDLGRRYGMALQLVNVLRDEHQDLAIGRRYIPPRADHVELLERARAGLASGMRYAAAVRPARVRLASALPALIGARTLSLVRAQGPGAKMPRREVRGLLARMLAGAGGHVPMELEFMRQNRAR